MKCTKCGYNNADIAAFCKKCGTKLKKEEPKSVPQIKNDDAIEKLKMEYKELKVKIDDLGKSIDSTSYLFYTMYEKVQKAEPDKDSMTRIIEEKDAELRKLKKIIDNQKSEIDKLKSMKMKKRCPKCNITFDNDVSYCSHCGEKLE